MKKLSTLILIAALMLSLMPCAFADSPKLTVSPVGNVKPGDEFTVTVTMSGNPGIAVAQIDILYDKTVLERTSILGKGLSSWTIGESAVWVDSKNSDYNGEILTMKFRVRDDAPNGKTEIALDGLLANFNEEIIDFEFVPATVSVSGGASAPKQPIGPTPATVPEGQITVNPGDPMTYEGPDELHTDVPAVLTPEPPIEAPAEVQAAAPIEAPAEDVTEPEPQESSKPGFLAAVAAFFARVWMWIKNLFN